MTSLREFYDKWSGTARYSHALFAAAITAICSFIPVPFWPGTLGIWGAFGISTNYLWQEWVRQAFFEWKAGQKIKWWDHFEQSVYPTVASIGVLLLFRVFGW